MRPLTLALLRLSWLVLPVAAGPAVGDALDVHSRAVQVMASTLAWAVWAVVLVAVLVPRTLSLTVVRMVTPGAVALVVWAAVATDRAAWAAAAVVAALVPLLAGASATVVDAFVDGSSYGDERRIALRLPAAVVAGPLVLAWVAMAAAFAAGPLLMATRQWVAGVVVCVLAAALVAAVGVRVHELSRRWLVFVPAGVVVHDLFVLGDPILLPRHLLRRLAPAEAGTDALDLTAGALGLALELRTAEPIDLALRHGRTVDERRGVPAVLVRPVRPGETLAIAEARRLPVG